MIFFHEFLCFVQCSQIFRPHEICERNKQEGAELSPEMFVGETNRFDVNQGQLGDCWFVATLSLLAENDYFLDRVIPPGQSFNKGYHGIFKFRFFKFGEWVEIVIDDRLPTRLLIAVSFTILNL